MARLRCQFHIPGPRPYESPGKIIKVTDMFSSEPIALTSYNAKRISWELERTALGDGYYGNALRVAKDMPGIDDKDRAVLDRWATGRQQAMDHVLLQGVAIKVYAGLAAQR